MSPSSTIPVLCGSIVLLHSFRPLPSQCKWQKQQGESCTEAPYPQAEFLILWWTGCPCCQGYRLSPMTETELWQIVKRLRSAKGHPLPDSYNPLPGAYSHKCPKSNGIPSVSWVLWQNRSHISFCVLGIQFSKQPQRQLPLEEQLWVTSQPTQCRWPLYLFSNNAHMCTMTIQNGKEGYLQTFLHFLTSSWY